ncbi:MULTISPECIES: hypothetical protein [Myxococcaceae]|uniref:hypothetical protein n=1 Tax=Myxococcaceae TaxID=31 RepID=UPI00129CCF74|nr:MULTISPECIES: hypothetical protein [Myxococcaceae]
MSRGQRVKAAVVHLQERSAEARVRQDADGRAVGAPAGHEPAEPIEASPLYGVALLKAAMELKRQPNRELEEILSGVLARMRIPEDEFRRYLAQNGGLLRQVAERKRF